MNRLVQFGVLLIFAALINGCKQDGIDQKLFINVEDDFYIDMFEDISNGENHFSFNIQSINEHECLNTIIDYDLQYDGIGNLIVLSINDIISPESCNVGIAPAFVSIPIEGIQKREYSIEINLKDVIINNGFLHVTDNDFYLEMSTEDGFEVVNKQLNKIPKKTIWGYVGYELESDKVAAEDFIKNVEQNASNINNSEDYTSGYYGYFTVLEDYSITLSDEVSNEFHNTFIFQYDEDPLFLTQLMESTCELNSGLKIHLFNGEGEVFTCP